MVGSRRSCIKLGRQDSANLLRIRGEGERACIGFVVNGGFRSADTGGGFGVANDADVRDSNGHDKEGKASFDDVYDSADPREYFETLGRLDYTAPRNGWLFFPALVQAKKRDGGKSEEVTVVDL